MRTGSGERAEVAITVGAEVRSYDSAIEPTRDAGGRITGVAWYAHDVTARRKAEAALFNLAAIVESSEDAVIGHDPDGLITSWNPAAERLYGYSPPEAIGRPLSILYPPDRLGELSMIVERLARGEPTLHFDTVRLRKDGSPIDVSLSVSPVRDAAGAIVGAATFARDITERLRAERFRDEYVSLVSHDLRAPLTVVLGMAGVLQKRLGLTGSEVDLKAAEAISVAATRMNAMIDDLVESARLEAGRLELRREPVDIERLVSGLLSHIATADDLRRIQTVFAEEVPAVTGDSEQLQRALANLITNALKYSPPESPVQVSVDRRNGDLVVCVVDRGVGIPAEDIPHIFDRFYRARLTRKAQGLGLGLYITRLLVEAHGGVIWVDSRLGQGSSFCFTLPVHIPA
jgi:PAS domain S-box-containing protein